MPVIPATQEAETGESPEPGKRRLPQAEITPLHSSRVPFPVLWSHRIGTRGGGQALSLEMVPQGGSKPLRSACGQQQNTRRGSGQGLKPMRVGRRALSVKGRSSATQRVLLCLLECSDTISALCNLRLPGSSDPLALASMSSWGYRHVPPHTTNFCIFSRDEVSPWTPSFLKASAIHGRHRPESPTDSFLCHILLASSIPREGFRAGLLREARHCTRFPELSSCSLRSTEHGWHGTHWDVRTHVAKSLPMVSLARARKWQLLEGPSTAGWCTRVKLWTMLTPSGGGGPGMEQGRRPGSKFKSCAVESWSPAPTSRSPPRGIS
ncbi:hypothetical protein AAY473_006091 [Plecturocebus cupreus]